MSLDVVKDKEEQMGIFNKIRNLFGHEEDTSQLIAEFKEKIRLHENQLFGLELYFKGINKLYSEQKALVETNKQSFQNTQQRGKDALIRARNLLQAVERDSSRIHDLRKFKFSPIHGHPMLEQMTHRAQILVKTYDELFPDRSRNSELTPNELMLLMEKASNTL